MYQWCIDKRIPVITHCSDKGFIVDKNAENMTDPGKQWKKVLDAYPELTICFAHFGKNQKWDRTISEYISGKKYKNVYADISSNPGTKSFYRNLSNLIDKNDHLKGKLLFGTDFMINLLTYCSYKRVSEDIQKHRCPRERYQAFYCKLQS